MYILWIFLFFRWATDFKDKLVSGKIPSLTKAKDIATVHWRNYSTQYDIQRAVQQPTANPGTGHRVKRSRQDDETQYQYRKRKAEQERLQTPEETQQPEARVEKTLCVKSVMKKIMKLTKENLKSQLNDKKKSLDELSKHHLTNYRNINKWIQGPSKI
jgi:hypothetical protein